MLFAANLSNWSKLNGGYASGSPSPSRSSQVRLSLLTSLIYLQFATVTYSSQQTRAPANSSLAG